MLHNAPRSLLPSSDAYNHRHGNQSVYGSPEGVNSSIRLFEVHLLTLHPAEERVSQQSKGGSCFRRRLGMRKADPSVLVDGRLAVFNAISDFASGDGLPALLNGNLSCSRENALPYLLSFSFSSLLDAHRKILSLIIYLSLIRMIASIR